MKARVVVMALTMAAALLAQPPRGGFRQNAGGPPPTPQEMLDRHVKRLSYFLTLTTEQQTQVTDILNADVNNLSTLRETLKTERQALLEAIKSNTGVPTAVAALSSTQAQIETIRANQMAQIYALLSPEQKTKLGDALNMLASVGGGPDGPGRGPRGPRGGFRHPR